MFNHVRPVSVASVGTNGLIYTTRDSIHEGSPAQWRFEPHVAEQVFNEMIAEAGVPVYFGEHLALGGLLDRYGGVTMEGKRIVSIRMESGLEFAADVFIDATYTGDLMAKSGVSYRVGRDDNVKFGETLNGVQTANATHHQFNLPVDPYIVPGDPSSGLLPGVIEYTPPADGSRDDRVQAYNFRMCQTNVAHNRVEWTMPDGYDPLRYELLLRYFDAGFDMMPLAPDEMPNDKTDTNNNGGLSTDNIGANWLYPYGNYELRRRMYADHELYQRGLMYTLATNPRVPEYIRTWMNEWGLAADEFGDNGNWPRELYIREARRMVGEYTMTEANVRGDVVAQDSIGMGSYTMDSHNVQRYVDAQGRVRNEGDVQVGGFSPYPISYGAITPLRKQCENLLVPVCLSASHIAYGSMRMEPVFMVLGHSAGAAAAIAVERRCAVQDIEYRNLRKILDKDGQICGPIPSDSFEGIVVDDTEAVYTGEWKESRSVTEYLNRGYMVDDGKGAGATAKFSVAIPDGLYMVMFCYTSHENRATNVKVLVRHANGSDYFVINERMNGKPRAWSVQIAKCRFKSRRKAEIIISNEGADGYVAVDGVWFIPAGK
jgi:hypothetical protein